MQSKQNLVNLSKKLPRGSIGVIAANSKCSRQAVYNFFKGELKTLSKINAITRETAKLLIELKQNAETLDKI